MVAGIDPVPPDGGFAGSGGAIVPGSVTASSVPECGFNDYLLDKIKAATASTPTAIRPATVTRETTDFDPGPLSFPAHECIEIPNPTAENGAPTSNQGFTPFPIHGRNAG